MSPTVINEGTPVFETQKNPDNRHAIQRSTCGVASMTMLLNSFGYQVSFDTLLNQVIAEGDYSVPTAFWNANDELCIPVTYDATRTLSDVELIQNAQREISNLGDFAWTGDILVEERPHPESVSGGFNIAKGIDYRAIERVINKYYPRVQIDWGASLNPRLSSQLRFGSVWSDLSSRARYSAPFSTPLPDCIGKHCMALVSINLPGFYERQEANSSSHIIFAHKVVRSNEGSGWVVHYHDPAFHSIQEGANSCRLDHLQQHFAGNMALIYPNDYES